MTTVEHTRRVQAPAKVNLYLRVVGRRSDGYHRLDSLMAPVDLFDELEVRVCRGPRRQVTLVCDSPAAPDGSDNVAFRAAELLLDRSGIAAEVDIRLTKRIPVGGGLGGGSSDAAATLVVLDQLLGTGLDVAEISRMGATLGADVPFFVCGRPARVEGIGEIVTPVAGWGGIPLVIAVPGVALSTRDIYSRFDARRPTAASLTNPGVATSIADFAGSRRPLHELLVNDLEAVAVEVCPEVLSVKELLLQRGAQGALMTGSGSGVFGICPTRQAAENVAIAMRNKGIWATAAETLELSPAAA